MTTTALNQLFSALKLKARIFHNGQYCGLWAVDTSGSNLMNFHVVSKGNCVLKVGNESYSLTEGDAVFMPTDTKHQMTVSLHTELTSNTITSVPMTHSVDDNSTGLVCGHFTHDHPVFNRLIAQLPQVIIVRHKQDESAAAILSLILAESRQTEEQTHYLLDRLADALFYILVRDNIDISSGVLAAMSHPKLSKPLTLIHEQLDQQLSVETLAQHAGMSRSAFSALFKQLLDLSPAEYTTQWRMTQAYRWLADDGISTLEAAIRCGYESEASFSKAFKRINGVGPGEIRKSSTHLS